MSTKAVIILRVVAQLLANSAIIILIPEPYKSLTGALAVAIGVILATIDPSYTLGRLGMDKRSYLGAVARHKAEIAKGQ